MAKEVTEEVADAEKRYIGAENIAVGQLAAASVSRMAGVIINL